VKCTIFNCSSRFNEFEKRNKEGERTIRRGKETHWKRDREGKKHKRRERGRES